MEDKEKVLKYLVEVEKLGAEILSDRREIVMLDKRRNQNREALRDLSRSGQKKCWVTVGSVLVEHDQETTRTLLETDQNQLNIDINKLRCELKVKVNNLRDIEMQPPVPGLMLVPMSEKESAGLTTADAVVVTYGTTSAPESATAFSSFTKNLYPLINIPPSLDKGWLGDANPAHILL